MNNLRVLHIVPWFPNEKNNTEAVFIVEHLKALNKFCYNEVLHISFGSSNFKNTYQTENIKTNRVNIKTYTSKWREKEFFAGIAVNKFLKKNNKTFDIINFHIAYPNAININEIKRKYPRLKYVITEHWTAYKNEFNLPKTNKGRLRIENIFNNQIPLFVVSKALGQNIRDFISKPDRKYIVIPNIIDCDNFTYKSKKNIGSFKFCSINNWNPMKNPFVLIKAFKQISDKYENTELILGGFGSIINEMQDLVRELGLFEKVQFRGRLDKQEVIELLQESNVYCQSSNYETFSVICAEAMAVGTPIITTNWGGVIDFVNQSNGTLVDDLEVESWFLAMEKNYMNSDSVNTKQISIDSRKKFNSNAVGELYYSELINIAND